MKAVALMSGGLDSILAARVIMEQGIEVVALHFTSPFCTCTPKNSACSAAKTAVDQLGIPLKTISKTQDYFEVIKHPKHGYGRNLNPCLDCRIHMFRSALAYMHEIGAGFLVTGETLGQRPMSQRRDAMDLIDREAGVAGLVVRPLSAQLLDPTIPEQKGWIDRQKLLDISGRSRKPQIALAAAYGIHDYPCPAGGCLLTDAGFAARMRDLIDRVPDFDVNDVNLLKVGRHFRISPAAKVIVGRDDAENQRLLTLAREADRFVQTIDVPGALLLIRGPVSDAERQAVASLAAWYSKARTLETARIQITDLPGYRASIAADPGPVVPVPTALILTANPQSPDALPLTRIDRDTN